MVRRSLFKSSRWGAAKPRSCQGPSTARPGAQKTREGKSRAAAVGMTRWGAAKPRSCQGPSTARPGAQKTREGKSRAAPVGMTRFGAGWVGPVTAREEL
jgi:hypothetical protein